MLKINEIKCESLNNPIGIDEEKPCFSFYITSDNVDTKLAAYQIRVFNNENAGDVVWDSSITHTEECISIKYNGAELCAYTRYYYEIIVWDNHNQTAISIGKNYFETGKMGEGWKAEFIGPSDKKEIKYDRVPFQMRKEFRIDRKVLSARIFASALGIYKASINGNTVGEDYFTPGWTVHEKRLQYQIYDVTDLLQNGDNAVGLTITNGWYHRYTNWLIWSPQDKWNNQICGILELRIQFDDGEIQIIKSDKDWKYGVGPIKMADFYDGETYDACEETPDWCKVGFDDKNWKNVKSNLYSKNVLCSTTNEPVRIIQRINPIAIIETPAGETVLDMGQNMVGFIEFSVSGNRGDSVILLHGEVLDKYGNFYNANLRSAKARIEYILKGDGVERFKPQFTFHGFRYVKVLNYPGILKLSNFTGCVLHSDMAKTGDFKCSNNMLNQLHSNIVWGLKGNFVDIPTDCPQRDERWGWTGDAQVFISTACSLYNSKAFYSKWLKDLAADQSSDGAVANSVPNFLFEEDGSTTTSAAWGDAACICPWTLYQYYGDKKILEDQYSSMHNWVEYIRKQGENEYLWDTDPQLGDWVALDAEEGSYTGATSKHYIATAFYAYSTSLLYKAAKVLDKESDMKEYNQLYEKIKAEFHRKYVNSFGEIKVKTQTAMALALKFDLIEKNNHKIVTKQLVELLKERNYHLSTGFVGTPYLLSALSDNGELDIAYKVLLQSDYPSWLYPLTKGATTIWEHWDGIKEDGTFWDTNMNSYNHYAYGAVGSWIYENIAGIKPDENYPGFKHFFINPKLGGDITRAGMNYTTPYGIVKINWEIKNREFYLDADIPCNSSSSVAMPNGEMHEVGSGEHKFKCEYPHQCN